ncbi:MAG TPA: SRPBCC family protein [Chitinophagaceae bacterium]|nr:SRPBCC family protein [Chitinophagaceae bacterium]
METTTKVTVETTVNAPVQKIWEYWNQPEHITQWGAASDDWHTSHAQNDLRAGGAFNYRMEARDGSMGFDFEGKYDDVAEHKHISYTMGDGRTVNIDFTGEGDTTRIVETFDAETENPVDMQRDGWQAILNNFKKHAEAQQ